MSAQSLIQQGYGGYAGWGDAEADADFRATGGSGKRTSGSSGASSSSSSNYGLQDPIALAKQYQDFMVQANQPAVQALQAQIPNVQQQFAQQRTSLEAEKEPLKQKYQSLLADITKTTSIATSREAGRRGISTESGMYDEWLRERIAPETERIGLAEQSDQRNITNLIAQLTSGEATATGDINSQIAQLMSGNAPQAISSAQNWQSVLDTAKKYQSDAAYQNAVLAQQQTPYGVLGEGQSLYDLMTGQIKTTAPKTYKAVQASAGGNDPLGLGVGG